jgi:hypothetical protein
VAAVNAEVLLLEQPGYREAPHKKAIAALDKGEMAVRSIVAKRKRDDVARALQDCPKPPRALIAWEEHSGVFVNREWRAVLTMLYEAGIMPMQIDYGYFDHYQTYIVDRYRERGEPTIRLDWPQMPSEDIRWEWAPQRLITYRDKVWAVGDEARRAGPLLEGEYVCIWTQAHTYMTRGVFSQGSRKKHTWLARLCEALRDQGRRPVVKTTPIRMGPNAPDWVTVFDGKVPFKERRILNARLALFAQQNIIITSSVSNELVLWSAPVMALGRSWFTGLNVFDEPDTWEEVGRVRPIDHVARTKWINWWLLRQCYAPDLPAKIRALLDGDIGAEGNDFPYAELYYEVYRRLGRRYRMSGWRFDIVRRYLTGESALIDGFPRTALDAGCGWGEVVSWLSGEGVDIRGIDIAQLPGRVPVGRYDLGDIRSMPYANAQFDLVLAIDVLEHLTEGDILAAYRELGRVGRKVFVQIMLTDDEAHNLEGWPRVHQTLRSPGWWRQKAGEAGLKVEREVVEPRHYIAVLGRG